VSTVSHGDSQDIPAVVFAREQILEIVAGTIVSRAIGGVVRAAIDGVSGAGKTTFADELAAIVRELGRPVVRASVDGFHNPRAIRYRKGQTSPDGYYEDSYDYEALHRNLLAPLGPGGSRRYRIASFDHFTDSPVEHPLCEAPAEAVLIFDGIFVQRPELRDYWDVGVFLDVPFEISIPRGAGRGPGFGSPDPLAPSNALYIGGETRYLRECAPTERATFVIDNSDLTQPAVVRGSLTQ
jgi:uridine kinase